MIKFENFGFQKISKMEYFRHFENYGSFFTSGRWEKIIRKEKQFNRFQYIIIKEEGDKIVFMISKPFLKRVNDWRNSLLISDMEWRIPIRRTEDLNNIKLLLEKIYNY